MSNKKMQFDLVNAGANMYDKSDLNKMFKTNDLDFLKTDPVKVLTRKFNFIGTMNNIAPRATTDLPTITSMYNCTNVGVKSDFPKTNASIPLGKMADDGTYLDMRAKVYAKQDEDLAMNVIFKPDTDFDLRFNRLNIEQALKTNISDYFGEREAIRTLENRIFLQEYGLSPDQVDEVMARSKVEDALKAMKDPKQIMINQKRKMESMLSNIVDNIRENEPSDYISDLTRNRIAVVPDETLAAPPASIMKKRRGPAVVESLEEYQKSGKFETDKSDNMNKEPAMIKLGGARMKNFLKTIDSANTNVDKLSVSELKKQVSQYLNMF